MSTTFSTRASLLEVLWGCELNSNIKRCVVKVEDNSLEHTVYLKSASLGEEATDELHVVAVECKNMSSGYRPVPLVSLQRSALPMVSLGNIEIVPPVTFILKSGTGPVYLTGQHWILERDADYESPGYETQMDERTQTDEDAQNEEDAHTDGTQTDEDSQTDGTWMSEDAQNNMNATQMYATDGESNPRSEDDPSSAPKTSGSLMLKRQSLRI